jgi:hypothetical protein
MVKKNLFCWSKKIFPRSMYASAHSTHTDGQAGQLTTQARDASEASPPVSCNWLAGYDWLTGWAGWLACDCLAGCDCLASWAGWLAGWLTGCCFLAVRWLAGWLGWLAGWLVGWRQRTFASAHTHMGWLAGWAGWLVRWRLAGWARLAAWLAGGNAHSRTRSHSLAHIRTRICTRTHTHTHTHAHVYFYMHTHTNTRDTTEKKNQKKYFPQKITFPHHLGLDAFCGAAGWCSCGWLSPWVAGWCSWMCLWMCL